MFLLPKTSLFMIDPPYMSSCNEFYSSKATNVYEYMYNNPIDKWCLSNTSIDVDKNDNIQPIKTSKQRKRIDGAAALLDAYVVLQDKMQDYQNMI